jgi:divalent metal cation (Fe/Co/Zn/Cd) transporter
VTAASYVALSRRARRLAWATVAWDVVEAVVALEAGAGASSIALVMILNTTVGWWSADPLAALGIAALAIDEGREAWHGEPLRPLHPTIARLR